MDHESTSLLAMFMLMSIGSRIAVERVGSTPVDGIARRYGTATASVVAMQLEYPWQGEAQ